MFIVSVVPVTSLFCLTYTFLLPCSIIQRCGAMHMKCPDIIGRISGIALVCMWRALPIPPGGVVSLNRCVSPPRNVTVRLHSVLLLLVLLLN